MRGLKRAHSRHSVRFGAASAVPSGRSKPVLDKCFVWCQHQSSMVHDENSDSDGHATAAAVWASDVSLSLRWAIRLDQEATGKQDRLSIEPCAPLATHPNRPCAVALPYKT
jgi:hypothetical protein